MRYITIILLVYSQLVSYSYANDMGHYVSKVLLDHASLKAHLHDIEQRYQQYHITFGDYQPNVSFTSRITADDTSNNSNSLSSSLQQQKYSTKQVGLTLRQNIFNFGGTLGDVENAKVDIGLAEAEFYRAERSILLEAVNAYINYFKAIAISDAQEQNLKRLEQSLEAANEMRLVGTATTTDVAQAQARLARGKADYAVATNNITIAESEFLRLYAIDPTSLANTGHAPILLDGLNIVPLNIEELLQYSHKYNADVQISLLTLDSIKASKYSNLDDFLPSLDLDASLTRQYSTNKLSADTTNSAQIGLSFTMPLYKQGTLHNSLYAFDAAIQSAHSTIKHTKDIVANDLRMQMANYESAVAQVSAYESALSSATLAMEGLMEEQRSGLRTILDVLDGEQEYLTSNVNLIRAKYDILLAQYAIYSLSGYLSPQILGFESLYSPTIDTAYTPFPFKPLYDVFE